MIAVDDKQRDEAIGYIEEYIEYLSKMIDKLEGVNTVILKPQETGYINRTKQCIWSMIQLFNNFKDGDIDALRRIIAMQDRAEHYLAMAQLIVMFRCTIAN